MEGEGHKDGTIMPLDVFDSAIFAEWGLSLSKPNSLKIMTFFLTRAFSYARVGFVNKSEDVKFDGHQGFSEE